MLSMEKYKKEVEGLKGKAKTEKMLLFSAILTEILKQDNIDLIIVGGFSVELYTRNSYVTEDIDFVMDGRDKANSVLLQLGFKQQGKDWLNGELGLVVEIPDNWLDGDYNRITKLNIGNGRYVNVIGIEDIICDRLRACKFWKSENDCEWAFRLFYSHKERIDIQYLNEKATKDGTYEIIEGWLKEIEDLR
ncbi:DUF6036 family nucleotidyltransferase [Aneurinibacillus terranovensis]|uniref:DUF6036 family nucleotidyltransferase n=1 Tax=Aneurinibacillus terranovensis TaxID=278991 RepID=UPI00041DCA47|nr:DUF6036 family nucleotidyltransferase [Aneurinibacillus terranovensis]